MREINEIQRQLDNVQAGLNELMSAIHDASMRTQYVSAQRVIIETWRIAGYYVNVTHQVNFTQDDVNYWKSEIDKWGSRVRESVFFLMDGFLGNHALAGDLLNYIVQADPDVLIYHKLIAFH